MEDDVLQNLALLVYSKFPTFNNSKTKEYSENYNFATFVKVYVKDATRKTRAQEKGYKSRDLTASAEKLQKQGQRRQNSLILRKRQ